MSPAGESVQVNLRADSKAQVERWRAAARRDKRTLSDWIRLTLDAAVDDTEQKSKR